MTLVQYAPSHVSRPKAHVSRWNPPVDIVESDNRFTLSFDLPGLERDKISVGVKDGVLTVTGERNPQNEAENDQYRYLERTVGSFTRSFRLPEYVDGANIAARYEQGVLTLEIPKKAEAKPVLIPVK